MSRSEIIYLQDSYESIEIIFNYTAHKTEFEFVNSMMLQHAVIRRFEIIGEASSKLSEETKNKKS